MSQQLLVSLRLAFTFLARMSTELHSIRFFFQTFMKRLHNFKLKSFKPTLEAGELNCFLNYDVSNFVYNISLNFYQIHTFDSGFKRLFRG